MKTISDETAAAYVGAFLMAAVSVPGVTLTCQRERDGALRFRVEKSDGRTRRVNGRMVDPRQIAALVSPFAIGRQDGGELSNALTLHVELEKDENR